MHWLQWKKNNDKRINANVDNETHALATMEKEQPVVALALHRFIVEKTAQRMNHVFKSAKHAI